MANLAELQEKETAGTLTAANKKALALLLAEQEAQNETGETTEPLNIGEGKRLGTINVEVVSLSVRNEFDESGDTVKVTAHEDPFADGELTEDARINGFGLILKCVQIGKDSLMSLTLWFNANQLVGTKFRSIEDIRNYAGEYITLYSVYDVKDGQTNPYTSKEMVYGHIGCQAFKPLSTRKLERLGL